MDANRREFSGPLGDEVYQVVGCAFEVLNQLGSGLLEKPYENALVVECRLRGIPVDQQKSFSINYKQHEVGFSRPDLIAFEKLIIDAKVIDQITNIERAQIINYLKITNLTVGLILNFKRSKLEWERIILESK